MKSNANSRASSRWALLVRVVPVAALVFLSAHCTSPQRDDDPGGELTANEQYLVDAYVQVARARELYAVNHLKSDSLFAWLDSTIDTLRIANTIRDLNRDPDRWLLVFRTIERDLQQASQGR